MAPDTPVVRSRITSSLYVVIPLRRRSRGCPNKSLRPFNSRTLLDYAIADAETLEPAGILVTTDYPVGDLPASAAPYYVRRPDHLCNDDTPMSLVLKHAAQSMYPMDTMLLFQPNCYHPGRSRLARRVVSERAGMTAVRYPDFWHPAYAIGGKLPKARQALQPAFRPDGLIYRIPVSHLMLLNPFQGPHVPVEGTINVDREADWQKLLEVYGATA